MRADLAGINMKCVGVLALQGAFFEHVQHLEKCVADNGYDVEILTVRTPEELSQCDALVLPGGESTSMSLIAQRTGMFPHLRKFVHDPSKAIWGTCAGLIYISQELANEGQLVQPLELLKVRVKRNAFGRQSHSFIQNCNFSEFIPGCHDFPAVFIRAPVIEHIFDTDDVKPLFTLENGLIVAASQGDNVLATSFHPELAENDSRFHDWFLKQFVLK